MTRSSLPEIYAIIKGITLLNGNELLNLNLDEMKTFDYITLLYTEVVTVPGSSL